MNIYRLISVLGLFFVLFAGCRTTYVDEGPAPAMKVNAPQGSYSGYRMNSVGILDESLQKWYYFYNTETGLRHDGKAGKIAVESTNSRRTQTGTLEAWAIIRNRTDYDLQLECRVHFYDTMQAPLEQPSAWKRIYLPANGTMAYQDSSISINNIGYYYIEIREGR